MNALELLGVFACLSISYIFGYMMGHRDKKGG
jgi:hypothetical protein